MWRKLAILTLMLIALASLGTQPVTAQSGVVWNTQFYNNIYLLGTPVLTRQDSTIAFDWLSGSPAAGVNPDNFSVRWGSDPYFPAGTYRFYTLADDNVCIRVDFQPILDTFNQSHIGEIRSADIALSAGTHHIQVDYRENTNNAYIYATWANLATNPAGPNFPTPGQIAPVINVYPSYWTAQYYSNTALWGMPTYIQTETWPLIRYWGSGSPVFNLPADNFSARWTGVQTLNAGTYQISVRADDGVRVFLDGRLVIDEYHSATGNSYSANVALVAGQHNFVVEYYEASGSAFVELILAPASNVVPQVATTSPGTLKVTASVLNLRHSPNCDCEVLTRVRFGETYPVVGRNSDSSWWQINVNGTIGWVFSQFTETFNVAGVPITDYSSTVLFPATGYKATATATSILRGHAGTRFAYLGYIPKGHSAQVVGRNADNTWWQVNYDGVIGWVRAALTLIEPSPNINQIPVRS
jgi:uncharacterized protein YraI